MVLTNVRPSRTSSTSPQVAFTQGKPVELWCAIPDIPDDPLDPAFFVCLAGIAGIKRESIVPCEVQGLRVIGDIGLSPYAHAFEIVAPVGGGHSPVFPKGLHMPIKEELHGVPEEELHIQIPGVRQKIDKAVYNTERQSWPKRTGQ